MVDSFFDFTPSDPIADLPTDKVERAMTLRNGLVALCEGQTKMNNAVYRLLRREFMADPEMSSLLPQFVRTAQDTGSMWAFMKDYSPHWEPRRRYVRDQFNALIDRLEQTLPLAAVQPDPSRNPAPPQNSSLAVDISTHKFDVALSFPGEVRPLVVEVAGFLETLLGPNTYFYDNNYVSQLARPSLDTFLQGIYRDRAKLIVVFLSADYQRKNWCGIEFRAIRDIIAKRNNERIMFVRTDDGAVEGVFATDGYVDARNHTSAALAQFILERAQLL